MLKAFRPTVLARRSVDCIAPLPKFPDDPDRRQVVQLWLDGHGQTIWEIDHGCNESGDLPLASDPDHTLSLAANAALTRKKKISSGKVSEYSRPYRNRLPSVVHKDSARARLWSNTCAYEAVNPRVAFYEDPDGASGPDTFTLALDDFPQLPTAAQVANGGLASTNCVPHPPHRSKYLLSHPTYAEMVFQPLDVGARLYLRQGAWKRCRSPGS